MSHSRRFWLVTALFAIGCGGRTLAGITLDGGEGGMVGDELTPYDGPIITIDGSVPFDVSIPTDGGGPPYDVVVPPPYYDVVVPPYYDAPYNFDSPYEFDSPYYFDSPYEFDSPYNFDSPYEFDAPYYYDVYIGPPPYDGPYMIDASSDGGAPVLCGYEVCSKKDQCCVTFSGGSLSESCVAPGDCDAGVVLSCTGSNNCTGGDVCCGMLGGGSGSATCEPMCGPGSVELCGDGKCPPGETCMGTPLGISFCRP